ncbi:MAG: nucleotidyltransferase family protein [Clostridia bacterium]|nr:nucleotidyltransferase family protein [Clostridia bacterium]
MLTALEREVIALIKDSLDEKKPEECPKIELDSLYKLAKAHQIIPLIFYGLAQIPELEKSPAFMKFMMTSASLVSFSEAQLSMLNQLFECFDKEGIEHLKMKGTILKKLYTYPEMRMMSDADIYVKIEKYPKIKAILEKLGFTFKCESDHEIIWCKDELVVEIHKRLIPSYTKDLARYYEGKEWEKLFLVENGRYEYKMKDEDTFIYLFTHFAKHYRDGGIGIKFMTDFYVFMNKLQLDYAYIESELEKMGLLEFYKNTKKTLDVWFCGGEENEVTDLITRKIFTSGAYGATKEKKRAEALKLSGKEKDLKKAKRKKKRGLLFPSYKQMCSKYKWLKKAPFMLPIMWIVRLVVALFKGKKSLKTFNRLDDVSKEEIESYDKELHMVGFPYNF